MEEIHCTLVAGRHEGIPSLCVYSQCGGVNAEGLEALSSQAHAFINEHMEIERMPFFHPAQASYADCEFYRGSKKLVVYITGFTPALTSLVKACVSQGVPMDVMHYDRETGEYVRQSVLP